MSAFAFSTVAHLLSEPGVTGGLGELIAERFPATRRPFIVTDAGSCARGCLTCPG